MSLASEFKTLGERNSRRALKKTHRTQAVRASKRARAARLLLSTGATVQETAEILGISTRTVDRAVKRKKEEKR